MAVGYSVDAGIIGTALETVESLFVIWRLVYKGYE